MSARRRNPGKGTRLATVGAGLLLSVAAADAADWQRVGTDGDENTYAVDTSRLSRDDSLVGFQVRTEYAKPRRVEGLDQDVFVALDRMVVDCAAGTFAIESRTFVLADGTEVPRGVTPKSDLRQRAAAAGSMSESIVRFACKAAGVTRPRS